MYLILGNPDIQVSDDKWSEEMENTMPAIFFGHGNPMNALPSNYETLGPDAMLSVPTPDHYLPLLFVIALQRKDEPVSFPVAGFDGGSISMLTVMIG
jgi:4,5-DOPA dioxygenase extradiol